MFNRVFALLIVLSMLCGAAVAADDLPTLIRQLGDRDPDVRERATSALFAQGDAAREALRAARRDKNLAISHAAGSLLMKLPWTRPGDTDAAVKLLRNYGVLDVDQRAQRLIQLLNSNDPATREQSAGIVLRIAQDEPSDEVLWRVLPYINEMSAKAALLKVDPATARAPVLAAIGRVRIDAGDQSGYDLLRRVIETESDWPTATADQIAGTVEKLQLRTDTREARVAAALALRHMAALRDTPEAATSDALRLFALHAKFGPLPGFGHDVAMVDEAVDARPLLGLAQVARRIGATVVASVLEQDAITKLADPASGPKRAERLYYAADMMQDLHRYDEAVQLYDLLLAAAEGDGDRIWVSNAYLHLYGIYSRRNEHLKAAEVLTNGLNNVTGAMVRTRDGESDVWEADDAWAEVDWHYYKAALESGDEKGADEHLRRILNSKGSAMSIYLDIYPALEKTARTAEIDAYFDRVYEKQLAKMTRSPNAAMPKNDMAWLCARSGRKLDEALKLAEEAVRLKPDEPGYLDTLAEVKFRTGDIDAAIQIERDALKMQPGLPFLSEQLERFKKAKATTRPAE